MSDTLADMITRIRNGQKANKVSVKAIFSKLNVNVCDVLKKEGYELLKLMNFPFMN